MIFAASGATRPFNGRVARLLDTELHGSFELVYMAPLDFELRGSLTSKLLGSHSGLRGLLSCKALKN